MNEFDELNEISKLSQEITDSPFGRIIWQCLGVEKDAFAENLREALWATFDRSVVCVAADVEAWCLATAPQAIANCERLALLGPKHASDFLKAGVDLSVLAMQDWELALSESNRLMTKMLKVTPKSQISPCDLANFFFQMAKGFSEISSLAKQLLEEFEKGKFNVLAGCVLYPQLVSQFKVHELSSLKVGDRYLNPSDPRDYTVSITLLLVFGRPDVIEKGLHPQLANEVVTAIITQRYVELGGEQGGDEGLESIARATLHKNWQMVANAPFLTGARQAAKDVIDKAVSLTENQQKFEIQILSS